MERHLAWSADLPLWIVIATIAFFVLSIVLMVVEARRAQSGKAFVLVTGILAVTFLLLAILRPSRVASREMSFGPRLLVLVDRSRSMLLPTDDGVRDSRQSAADAAVDRLRKEGKDVRFTIKDFGEKSAKDSSASSSDARTAILREVEASEERPENVLIVSDGRWDAPGSSKEDNESLAKEVGLRIHTVSTAKGAPSDASIRRVSLAGVAIAHAPFPVHVEVGCERLSCGEVPVTVRELRAAEEPTVIGKGKVDASSGTGTVDLQVAIERAGNRVIEVAIDAPSGDTIPANDRRFLSLRVTRDRVRILHVAGRATNDVRALRRWLKGNASIDLVTFFILRSPDKQAFAAENELALIVFPVDELFNEHLPSFDAIILQDFNAVTYKLARHLPALARYVATGGGLIMVGGPDAFVAGGYASSPLRTVLPVDLDKNLVIRHDLSDYKPNWTEEAADAPIVARLREINGNDLPTFSGANIVGNARGTSTVLWTHPTLKTADGSPMPILAVGDQGDGRSIALGTDSTWQLIFSETGAAHDGEGYGALWEGLLGWLMHDPRYDAGTIELSGGRLTGDPPIVRVRGKKKKTRISLRRLALDRSPIETKEADGDQAVTFAPLPPGGYFVEALSEGSTPLRKEFVCEDGGEEWADSRPDVERLALLARASKGTYRAFGEDPLPDLPPAMVIKAEQTSTPLLAPWIWSLLAATAVGAHWLVRRHRGLV